jgi:hypothetical protein
MMPLQLYIIDQAGVVHHQNLIQSGQGRTKGWAPALTQAYYGPSWDNT